MKIERSKQFLKEFLRIPQDLQRKAVRAIGQYCDNPEYPSLGVKKMRGKKGVWEMRVSKSYRITFHKIDDGICLRHIGTHDILGKE